MADLMSIVRHDASGAITPEWMIGHNSPATAERVVITRSQVYPCVARPGPAWTWLYSYQADNGPVREYGRSLVETRRFVRRNFPTAAVTEAWADR